jgi:hypothetical protein
MFEKLAQLLGERLSPGGVVEQLFAVVRGKGMDHVVNIHECLQANDRVKRRGKYRHQYKSVHIDIKTYYRQHP